MYEFCVQNQERNRLIDSKPATARDLKLDCFCQAQRCAHEDCVPVMNNGIKRWRLGRRLRRGNCAQ